MNKSLTILFLRSWKPLSHAATYSNISRVGVGATESQLLMHARALHELGHRIYVLGCSSTEREEEGIHFLSEDSFEASLRRIKYEIPNCTLIFTNTVEHLVSLSESLPKVRIIQVCQNGPNFEWDRVINAYLMVGEGQLAYYSVKRARYRHKFFLVPNCSLIEPSTNHGPKKFQVLWVGAITKQGLRRWGKALSRLLMEFTELKWVICAPSYSDLCAEFPEALQGLSLPRDRIQIKSITQIELAQELARSMVVLASLGGEDGPVSYFDAHRVGIPLLCGNDIIGHYTSLPGVALRCDTSEQCYRSLRFLLQNPLVAEKIGKLAQEYFSPICSEVQKSRLKSLVEVMQLPDAISPRSTKTMAGSDRKWGMPYYFERATIKFAIMRKKLFSSKE